ncbi:hypothetical protein EDC39_10814 [Geothermobacter ehrlichii]|uniref:Uncharacterized protein n=1 Tax=Geothermobacter ehrlichii TaxID=213224 RepID=A0A5D3WJM2_9BACT|nr:hypothetical protein [Geothermobacter ehrlichii]TYO98077.1 hypothetical protein EDC39_10814 [Geothermobacter ehrlichii]
MSKDSENKDGKGVLIPFRSRQKGGTKDDAGVEEKTPESAREASCQDAQEVGKPVDRPPKEDRQKHPEKRGRSREAEEMSRKVMEAIAKQPPMSPEEFSRQTKKLLEKARPIISRKERSSYSAIRDVKTGHCPDVLTSRLDADPRPEGEALRSLLHLWLKIFGTPKQYGTSGRELLRFLRPVLEGRVVAVLEQLEASSDSRDRKVAEILREYGLKWHSPGLLPANILARVDFGWIGIEMGNPSVDPAEGTIIVETPTVPVLEEFIQGLGGTKQSNPYFATGFYKVENQILGYIEKARLLAREHELYVSILDWRGIVVWKKGGWQR